MIARPGPDLRQATPRARSGRVTMERLYRVRTPEMVELAFPIAGLASRSLSWLADAVVLACVLGAIASLALCAGIAAVPALGPQAFLTVAAIALVVGFVAFWGYAVAFEVAWDGRTPGKRLLGLRVAWACRRRRQLHRWCSSRMSNAAWSCAAW